ncbi:MAG: 50S ribosomal protein L18 [Dehalococcoidia bacterium]|jgi:large subunit ribosomal protein L18|nr:50S ribosomal protein L18 [Dehalococcoidia bacterium]
MAAKTRRAARLRRHVRLRKKLRGSAQRPRLAVFRSGRHIYAQLIDDDTGRTLVTASDMEADMRDEAPATKTEIAKRVGELVGKRANDAGHRAVIFDRGGFTFAGRVKALAEAAREEGLEF